MNPQRELHSRRTRRHGHPYRRNPRQVTQNGNGNDESRSDDTPNVLRALLPMFRMQRQLLELSRSFCERMRDKLEQAETSRKQELAQSQPKKWVSRLHLPGFRPEEINVKINDNNVVVSSRENGSLIRTINLPPDVDSDGIGVFVAENDVIVFEAPFRPKEYCETSSQTGTLTETNASQAKITTTVKIPIEPFIEQTGCFPMANEQVLGSARLSDEKSKEMLLSEKNSLNSNSASTLFETNSEISETQDRFDKGTTTDKWYPSTESSSENNIFKFDFNAMKFPKENVFITVKGHTLILKAEIENKVGDLEYTETFRRQYRLPDRIDVWRLKCMRRSDGSLHIRAPYLDSKSD